MLTGTSLPAIKTEVPGPRSVALVDELARSECPAITARRARRAAETGVGQDPIVWKRAKGANVEDVDGNVYVDFTGAFAVAGIGHTHPRVVEAAQRQSQELIHAMGDVYPSEAKIRFTRKLAEVAPAELTHAILGLSGASAIEAALKTAAVHTGRPGVLAFWGGYHGLSYGALSVTAYRDNFRRPFMAQLNPWVTHVPYPDTYRPPFGLAPGTSPEQVSQTTLAHLRALLSGPATGAETIGAILIEPLQGRGGEIEPPPGFLAGLRALCDEFGLLLIFDEIYTGFGRTGTMFACEHEGVIPDILCVGKALGGGFPLSAAIGRQEVMDSWGNSAGESVHTSTFLGNPLGCAMAEAVLDVLVEEDWPARVARRGVEIRGRLQELARRWPERIGLVRGRGLMLGLELITDAETRAPDGALGLALVGICRDQGYLLLPSGQHGHVLALSPPFGVTDEQWEGLFEVLTRAFEECCGAP
ncbi:aspartate aminotransferase family protein [Lujinxingia litoralis]|uniref:Aspartate aminotransferase family protein n=1 Tax=Lujinxingia litoralis TaxID=2211119 RepID=A0A328CDK5_9DELT|nr:aspartate aminotransferase family protein [Lujinxingia litoralis]RAL25059.1 aspartate aminotransferase family protein [Lujinxingia litoralis]